ncbi:MAG: hypothetical protein P8Y53_18765, partial [Pseudolabrys sp.]
MPAFAMYLSCVADFYTYAPAREMTAIIEIGPGLGLSSLAHMAINRALRVIVNIDIMPVRYLSTQFLKSIDGIDVSAALQKPVAPDTLVEAVEHFAQQGHGDRIFAGEDHPRR